MWHIYISPCPNDTFTFYHLQKTNTQTIQLNFDDIQNLNERCLRQEGDVIKISFALYPAIQEQYAILESGSALGEECGPLLIGKRHLSQQEIEELPIALPGRYTTANRLFELLYPKAKSKIFVRYDQIFSSIDAGKAVAGVIIHESRFTYSANGFVLVADLGDSFEKKYQTLLPLGGIVGKREYGVEKLKIIADQIKDSIEWAMAHRDDKGLRDFIREHAREMDDKITQEHIHLYVNQFSLTLGVQGRDAIARLLQDKMHTNKIHFI